jgi:nitrite reductase/ring-hydroxylating ferredoxin subunit
MMTDPSEAAFVTVAKVGEIAPGCGGTFNVGERLVAVFNSDGEYLAIDDLCPHMGASLGAGQVEDGVVACPWHAWRFKVCDGTWCDNPRIKIDSFDIRIAGDEIQVSVVPRPKDDAEENAA